LTLLDVLHVEEYLSKTRTSRRADKIQDRLERKITKLLEQIKDEVLKTDIYTIKQKYQKQVYDLLRFGIEDAYYEGLEYSDKALGQRQPITVKDIEKINMMTQKAEDRFWGAVMRIDRIREFSFSFFISVITTMISDIITKSVNTATLANAEPTGIDDFQDVVQVMFKTREDEKVCPICEPYNNNVYSVNDSSKPEIPDDTHHNCRCRYLVYQDGVEVAG
jgi:hypothetical protein